MNKEMPLKPKLKTGDKVDWSMASFAFRHKEETLDGKIGHALIEEYGDGPFIVGVVFNDHVCLMKNDRLLKSPYDRSYKYFPIEYLVKCPE